jgi:hypothetical protein
MSIGIAPRARKRTAFHEAGHTVVGWALGLKVGRVCILDDLSGRADVDIPDDLVLVDRIAIAMGGWYGAELSGVENINDEETLGDETHVLALTMEAFPDDEAFQDALRRGGCDRAAAIINQHVDLVSIVARELLRRGDIPEHEVSPLLPVAPIRQKP